MGTNVLGVIKAETVELFDFVRIQSIVILKKTGSIGITPKSASELRGVFERDIGSQRYRVRINSQGSSVESKTVEMRLNNSWIFPDSLKIGAMIEYTGFCMAINSKLIPITW